ncbi:zinc knuckle CX2CX4HX4C containing protein [Tanacetum coccineum]
MDSILKPKKTTRTMSPETGDTMKHRYMLGRSSQVNFKERVARSSSKMGDSVADMEEDAYVGAGGVSNGIRDGVSSRMDGLHKDGGSSEMNESKLIFGSVSKELFGSSVVPEMPVPFDENHILNPNANINQNSKSNNVKMNESKEACSGLKFVLSTLNEEGREVAIMDPVLEEGIQKWSMTIVGHFVGFQMGYSEILGHLKRMWHLYQLDEVPLWVKIYDIPLEAWNVDGISGIASRIGVPIIMDKITTSICEKPFGRASYAKVLVEVDAAKGLVDSIEIWYKSLGKSMVLNVEYVWRPLLCEHCKTFGHLSRLCSKAQVNVDKKVGGDENRRNFRAVGNVVNDQEGCNDKNMNVDECLVADEVVNTNSSAGIEVSSVKSDSKKESGNLGRNGKSSGGKDKGSVFKDDISVKNRFDVLNKDNDIEVSDVWDDVRARIAIACMSGIPIADEEVNKWPTDMVKLYKEKWKERSYANKSPAELKLIEVMESLHTRIVYLNRNLYENAHVNALRLVKENDEATVEELQWERRRVEVDLFMLSKMPLMDDFKEIYTEDMVEYFFERCEEIKNDAKNGHYADDSGSGNMEEVSEVVSGSANFIAQNEVSNDIDGSMAQMQGGLAAHPLNL